MIAQTDAFIALFSKIFISWPRDHLTGSYDKIPYGVVKSVIFKVMLIRWSHDTSFWSICDDDYYQHIFITKKALRNQFLLYTFFIKYAGVQVFEFRHNSKNFIEFWVYLKLEITMTCTFLSFRLWSYSSLRAQMRYKIF